MRLTEKSIGKSFDDGLVDDLGWEEKILEAAEKLFTHKGYMQVTIQDIENLSGSCAGMLAHCFGTKEAVRSLVVERQLAYATQVLESLFMGEREESLEGVVEKIESLFEFCRNNPIFYRTYIWALIDRGEVAERMKQVLFAPLIEKLAKHIEPFLPREKEAEVRRLGQMILGHLHQYSLLRWHRGAFYTRENPSAEEVDNFSSLLIKQIRRALFEANQTNP